MDIEQIAKADIASLGKLIYTLATGKEIEKDPTKFMEFK
jgi:hypothetical protein